MKVRDKQPSYLKAIEPKIVKANIQLPKNGNGKANKLAPEDRAFHDWYRFVLSFPPTSSEIILLSLVSEPKASF